MFICLLCLIQHAQVQCPVTLSQKSVPCQIYCIKWICSYGVATISRLLKITGLFCKRAL